jgi:hypothetical protein
MRKCLILLFAASAIHAAAIQGTVVENQTGHPLARSLVALEPVAGTPGAPLSVRTNAYGGFKFSLLPAGAYLITASRTGFASVQYGQKQWKSSGVPVVVSDDDSPALTIRLPRFGSITGTVLDENDVGLPEYEVLAYRNTRPPQLVTRAKSDDRGIYRLYGLKPGSYLVRSSGKQYEDAEYLPTFSRETQNIDQAYAVDVNLDQQVDQADVRPATGKLYTLKVDIVTVPERPVDDLTVTVTLVSSLGRETVKGRSHVFGPVPAGQYELYAEAPLDRRPGIQGHYEKLNVARNTEFKTVLHEVMPLQISFEGVPVQATADGSIQVLGRRKDLAGESAAEVLKPAGGRVQLAAGPWELAIQPTPGFYVSGFSGPAHKRPSDLRFDCWNEVNVSYSYSSVRFILASNPGGVYGKVKSGSETVAGAPVFLESTDLEPQRRVMEVFVTRTDIHGQYRFAGLGPGNYRVLSSFEYQMPDPQTMLNAGAKPVKVEAGRDAQQDLDLYVIK